MNTPATRDTNTKIDRYFIIAQICKIYITLEYINQHHGLKNKISNKL